VSLKSGIIVSEWCCVMLENDGEVVVYCDVLYFI